MLRAIAAEFNRRGIRDSERRALHGFPTLDDSASGYLALPGFQLSETALELGAPQVAIYSYGNSIAHRLSAWRGSVFLLRTLLDKAQPLLCASPVGSHSRECVVLYSPSRCPVCRQFF